MDGTGEPSDREMPTEIILLVSDSDDSKLGEITVPDGPNWGLKKT